MWAGVAVVELAPAWPASVAPQGYRPARDGLVPIPQDGATENILLLVLSWLLMLPVVVYTGQTTEVPTVKSLPPIPFSLDELHSWIDRTHPFLKGAGAENTIARGKMLKALGAFEPAIVNDTELERFIPSSDPSKGTQTVGFIDVSIWIKRKIYYGS